jgi:DnaJ-class molecular chaperone
MTLETPTMRHNYYEILELNTNAAQHEITTAYERARATYSGDNPAIYTIFSEKEARDLLGLIEEAYSILGNKTLRNIYDQRLLGQKAQQQDLTYESILQASRQLFPELKNESKKSAYTLDEDFEKMIAAQQDWSGELIKKVREYKNISLEKMSLVTKVNTYYIVAVEEMNPASLPATVFVRGYVVQLAKELGLNEKTVADSYMKLYKEKLK